jgi:hypothetical protein
MISAVLWQHAATVLQCNELKISICLENHKDKYTVQENLRKATVYVRRVCMYVCKEFGSSWTDFH